MAIWSISDLLNMEALNRGFLLRYNTVKDWDKNPKPSILLRISDFPIFFVAAITSNKEVQVKLYEDVVVTTNGIEETFHSVNRTIPKSTTTKFHTNPTITNYGVQLAHGFTDSGIDKIVFSYVLKPTSLYLLEFDLKLNSTLVDVDIVIYDGN